MKITSDELERRKRNNIRKNDNNPPHLHCVECLEDFICSGHCICQDEKGPFEGICRCPKHAVAYCLGNHTLSQDRIELYIKCYSYNQMKDLGLIPLLICEAI